MEYNIFAGCSFTWGQGLWSYSDTKEYVPTAPEYTVHNFPIPKEADEFRIKNRYPSIVCNHINGIPLVKPYNGGTDYESIEYINGWIRDYKNINYLIFQTTQLYRSPFPFTLNNKLYHLRSTPNFKNLTRVDLVKYQNEYKIEYEVDDVGIDYFYEWLIENNLGVDDIENIQRNYLIDLIETTFKKCESLGIKPYILCWTNEYLESIYKNSYLLDKFINFEYKNKIYDSIFKMQKENEELRIQYDVNKIHNDDGDDHPSLECHKIIANSIIKKIQEYE